MDTQTEDRRSHGCSIFKNYAEKGKIQN